MASSLEFRGGDQQDGCLVSRSGRGRGRGDRYSSTDRRISRADMTIEGMTIVPLRIIGDERGAVMHMLRADAQHFLSFGEIYFSAVYRGVVKGWKRHSRMTLNLAAPVGRVRLVAFDDRPHSNSKGRSVDLVLGP